MIGKFHETRGYETFEVRFLEHSIFGSLDNTKAAADISEIFIAYADIDVITLIF